ncbi:MAG: PAS domain-containing methyl-accepting chemotaxis protein [Candidatus Brevundimonas phytovorans]|nr:PAS domain-containing methyl-accepting chemotaxis protein [Brevundimonas sp.]WEK57165.1 MAG: PAS domain-containing methyl-accepting chemotaxis protein [Brevundimonas sp.]
MSRTAAAHAAERLDDLIVAGPEDDPDAFARAVVRSTSAALMMVDRDLTIIDLNDATRALLKANEAAFARAFPGVALDRMVGTSIDVFHKDPSHQRAMLAHPLARPHIAEISVGDLRFALRVMSVLDAGGDYVGNVLEWNDVTELRKHAGMLEALSKAQAVIEFNLDGTIQSANGNFLSTTGYRLEEIVGRHHSMFVDPAEVQSGAYRAFWEKLGRGEYDAGQYRRVGKDGREVWLQASYNPILDARGTPLKVVKFATDISAQKQVAARVTEISGIVASAASQMRATAESMAGTAEETTRQAGAVTAAAEVTSVNVQTVSSAGEELTASISEIARQVAESSSISQHAVTEADRTSEAIRTLADAAQKIGNVVTLINDIAGQTKLLALNATIEAARAGEAGKGFAVVASEVKSLSDQTARATHEISSQVAAMQSATQTSVGAIGSITDTIRKVADIASAIAGAVEEQSAATREIAANVTQVAEGTRQVSTSIAGVNAAAVQTSDASSELLNASGELARQAEALTAEMDRLAAA